MNNHKKAFYFAALTIAALNAGCGDPRQVRQGGDKPQSHTASTTSTYSVYEFQALAPTYRADKLHSITSSHQGKVYLAGQQSDLLAVIDRTDDGLTWEQMILASDKTGDGKKHIFGIKNSKSKIKLTAPLHDGILIYEPATTVIGILLDNSLNTDLIWKHTEAGFAARPLAFFEVQTPGQTLIYASTDAFKNSLFYFDRSLPRSAWVSGFTKNGDDGTNPAIPLASKYPVLTLGLNSLLLATAKGNISEIEKSNFGTTDVAKKKLKNDGALSITNNPELRHDPAFDNDAISSMLLVDGKYLLVGFKDKGPNTGGLFYRDITAGLPLKPLQKWETTGADDHNINAMMLDRYNPKRALIATDMGLMIFEDGKIVEVISGQKLITPALVADAQHQGNLTDKALAKTGFAGELREAKLRGIAQDSHGKFYFITPTTVSTLVITSKDF